ncbi:MAG: dihydrodipicolinate synthase family protein, partial [Chlamydiales bacterium]|nr:dihydrodipicolinate synthase family protein [Chlamydiales bacterium]
FLHFEAISKAITLPLCVYNHPGRCAVNINTATMQQIAALPNVVGIKECSGSFQLLTDVVEKICSKHPRISLFCGDDPMTIALMTMGASGVMSVLSNLMPKTIKQLVQHMTEGRIQEARALHYKLKPVLDVLFVESNPIGIKYLMQLANLTSGHLRLPLTMASPQAQAKLAAGFNACRELIEKELPVGALS